MNARSPRINSIWTLLMVLWSCGPSRSIASIPFTREFAPQEGQVTAPEQPYRSELSLNGRWQFQPMPIPGGYVRDLGIPPELPLPDPARWETTLIKIPSPWNVNSWGGGRDVGAGTAHPYWPSSVTFPSYPPAWDGVEMGWLRRRFPAPSDWKGRQLLLHFEAVAGECRVLVNGHMVGEHFDSYTPFTLNVTPYVRLNGDNELLVGVRRRHLFNKTDPRYPHARAPYALGSNTDALGGIWQDVSLLAISPTHVADCFVKPFVDRDQLEIDVTLANTSAQARSLGIEGTVAPWVNLAGKSVLDAPEPRWKLASAVLSLPARQTMVPPGQTVHLLLRVTVKGRLKLWSPDTPNLNGLVISVTQGGKIVDRKYTRFGWRQLAIHGHDLHLNGRKIQLVGDLVHPFGGFVMSRRYPWAWYRMVKDFGGNAIRLHAQPMPGFYLDLADEMGLMILDETALFGSSLQLNFAEPVAWDRFAEHYDSLVLRDRNHPSVFGWSMGNELFAIFEYNHVAPPETDRWYAQLAQLGLRARGLDPTREWISCDGDDDLRGALPVWTKHLGHGLHLDAIKEVEKPRMVGESGGTYYATPPLMSEFNGDRAFENYEGRNEALAIDLYQNVVRMARPMLTFFSVSEMVWFGLEPLPYGYSDFTRLPTSEDGIVFTAPFREGKPGWQIEHIPPYVATLNPGWDPSLPLYRPLPMFQAMKSALAAAGPAPSPWDHRPAVMAVPPPPAPSISSVGFVGAHSGALYPFLYRCGTPLSELAPAAGTERFLIIDAEALTSADIVPTRKRMQAVLGGSGVVLVAAGGEHITLDVLNALLPAPVTLTSRHATLLTRKNADAWTLPMGLSDLYFAEDKVDKEILKHGLSGAFTAQGNILLQAANADWSLFDAGENVKCGALVLYEHLEKPVGAALVVRKEGQGRLALSAISANSNAPAQITLWRKMLTNMGVRMEAPRQAGPAGSSGAALEHDLLRNGPDSKPR